MDNFKFNIGDYVCLDRPNKDESYPDSSIGKIFTIFNREFNDYKECNAYSTGRWCIEEDAFSLVTRREDSPDYEIGDIVTVTQSDVSLHDDWVGQECEIIKVEHFPIPDMKKVSIALLKMIATGESAWFCVHEFRSENIEIEPITNEDIIQILE